MDGAFHEPRIERLIREASEEGEFDDLPGSGKPIRQLGRPYAPTWWAQAWVDRERASAAAVELASRVRRSVPRMLAGSDPAVMRSELSALNADIAVMNDRLAAPDRLPVLDIDRLLADRTDRLS